MPVPAVETETHLLLFEPKSTLDTGEVHDERTVPVRERIQ
jgi:hypothetical protein